MLQVTWATEDRTFQAWLTVKALRDTAAGVFIFSLLVGERRKPCCSPCWSTTGGHERVHERLRGPQSPAPGAVRRRDGG
ncbi:hypothetical protein DXZ75_19715 [Streptomyces sp. AcE210]|nr:hypothetical protein DXZ75_19715 [Streptomyces sp. AcE210]